MAKMSISLPQGTALRARALAERHEGNVSALVAELIEREADRVDSLEAVAEWESEHGQITPEELRAARQRWLG